MKLEFHWTNIIGLSRSLLAIGTFLTLAFNPTDILFNVSFFDQNVSLLQKYSLFVVFSENLEIARIIAMIILSLVIAGIYPRWTGLLHWYVSYSFFVSSFVVDGGDQISSILTLLLIPITILDSRKNHWNSAEYSVNNLKSTISLSFYWLIKIQVCVIYLHAFTGKIPIDEWINGTATYYWLTHAYFGVHPLLNSSVKMLLSNGFIVVFLTWGVLILEFLLAACILLGSKNNTKRVMLICGIVFHFSILIVHGLVSFFFAIVAGLILYLTDNDKLINFSQIYIIAVRYVKRIYRRNNL